MSRPLTAAEAAAALRRGVEIEQFICLDGSHVRYLTAHRRGSQYVVRQHVVHDDGNAECYDLSEFTPVDRDEQVGEGVAVGAHVEPARAVESAAQHGGSGERWVNQAMAAEDYRRTKQGG